MFSRDQMAKLENLRGALKADELLADALDKLVEDCKANPVEPTPVVHVVQAKDLRRPTTEGRGRGWRRASGKLK